MKYKKLWCASMILCMLLSTSLIGSATKTFNDKENDVRYYEEGSLYRDDENTPIDDPKVDIVSLSCEVSTIGTTILLNIADDFATGFDEFYSYGIYVFPDYEVYDYFNILYHTELEEERWTEYVNEPGATFTVNGPTLQVFFEGLFLNESTVGLEAYAIHGTVDTGYSQDWYPDGEEKETNSDSSSDTNNDDLSTDKQNQETSSRTPGFEWVTLIFGLAIIILLFRRK